MSPVQPQGAFKVADGFVVLAKAEQDPPAEEVKADGSGDAGTDELRQDQSTAPASNETVQRHPSLGNAIPFIKHCFSKDLGWFQPVRVG
jgi:hypothetical protein